MRPHNTQSDQFRWNKTFSLITTIQCNLLRPSSTVQRIYCNYIMINTIQHTHTDTHMMEFYIFCEKIRQKWTKIINNVVVHWFCFGAVEVEKNVKLKQIHVEQGLSETCMHIHSIQRIVNRSMAIGQPVACLTYILVPRHILNCIMWKWHTHTRKHTQN